MTFLHFVKVVRDVFEYKCQIWTCDVKLLYVFDLNYLHDLPDFSTSGYYEGDKTSTVEREYPRTT